MINYFESVTTLEDLKKAYHAAAVKLHPDNGGNEDDMKELNRQYGYMFEQVKNKHRNKDGEMYEKDTQEAASDFIDLLKQLFKIPGLTIEILGSFVWIGGETKENKDFLKSLGFKWSSNKSLWYKSPAGYRKRSRSDDWTIDEIRATFRNNGTYNTDGQPRRNFSQLALNG